MAAASVCHQARVIKPMITPSAKTVGWVVTSDSNSGSMTSTPVRFPASLIGVARSAVVFRRQAVVRCDVSQRTRHPATTCSAGILRARDSSTAARPAPRLGAGNPGDPLGDRRHVRPKCGRHAAIMEDGLGRILVACRQPVIFRGGPSAKRNVSMARDCLSRSHWSDCVRCRGVVAPTAGTRARDACASVVSERSARR